MKMGNYTTLTEVEQRNIHTNTHLHSILQNVLILITHLLLTIPAF